MKSILREPLVHFALIGALIFAAWSAVGEPVREPDRLVITRGQIEALERGFAGTWQRPATADELESLIAERIREEVWCREAVALGLDRDDPVIRRRLRQKMEFLADDAGAGTQPDDGALRSYLEAHDERYRIDRAFTFRHVYLDPGAHGTRLASDTADLIAQLQREGAEADLSKAGDPFLLERDFEQAFATDIAQQFGDAFLSALTTAEPLRWVGPIPSAFGQHIVFIRQRTDGRLPSFEEVRTQVLEDWREEHRRDANERAYRRLLAGYQVTVERPAVHSGDASAATGPPP